jgi:hypothetical protein
VKRKKSPPPPPSSPEGFELPVRRWNALVDWLAKYRPLLIEAAASRVFAHPFRVSVDWAAAEGVALARLVPGFVNGRAPLVAAFGESGRVERDLIELPRLALEGFRPEPDPPAWFAARWNVAKTEPETLTSLDGPSAGAREVRDPASASRGGPRRLLALDLILSQTRPAANLELDPQTGLYGLRVSGSVGARARIAPSRAAWQARREPSPLDLLAGGHVDAGVDSVPVATVYALSPEYSEAEEPGEGFLFFVRQRLFWNLNYSAKLPPLLAVGAGFYRIGDVLPYGGQIINSLIADLERRDNLAAALAGDTQAAGRFWTI